MTTTTSRRAILAGAAALPALALPALAEEPNPFSKLPRPITADALRDALRQVDPDIKELIFALAREDYETEQAVADAKADAKVKKLFIKLQVAMAKWQAYCDGPHAKASKQFNKLAPPRREIPWAKPLPAKIARQLPPMGNGKKRTDITWGEYQLIKKIAPKHPVLAQLEKNSKERNAGWDADVKERGRISKQCGLDLAEKKQDRLYNLCYPIYNEILDTPAKTVAGVRVKFLAAKAMHIDTSDDLEEENLGPEWASIRRDILALAATPTA